MFSSKDADCQGSLATLKRREFLRFGAGAAATLMASPVFAKISTRQERSLSFYHTHTSETTSTLYWAEGEYLESGLQEINTILRDHRSGEIYTMDSRLLDLLYVLRSQVDSRETYQIISGYRSPATNASLRKKSSGVAKRSYHMQGKAIDVRLPGTDLKKLHTAALALQSGGVGYYPSSDFIHVDVGPVRHW